MRSLACGSDVPLDQVRLFDRDIEVLLVGELDLYVVPLTDAVDLQEDSDSVVHMHHVIALVKLHEAVKGRGLSVLQGLDDLLPASEYLVLTEDDELLASD